MAYYVQHLGPETSQGFAVLWTSPAFEKPDGLQDLCDDINTLLGDDAHANGHYRVLEWEQK